MIQPLITQCLRSITCILSCYFIFWVRKQWNSCTEAQMAPIQGWCNLQNPLLKASSCYARKVLQSLLGMPAGTPHTYLSGKVHLHSCPQDLITKACGLGIYVGTSHALQMAAASKSTQSVVVSLPSSQVFYYTMAKVPAQIKSAAKGNSNHVVFSSVSFFGPSPGALHT